MGSSGGHCIPSATSANMDGFAVLDQLVDMITSGVANIKRAYVAADATPPNLDEPWVPLPIEQETAARANLVSAAAFQVVNSFYRVKYA
jgi:hypothetical protein